MVILIIYEWWLMVIHVRVRRVKWPKGQLTWQIRVRLATESKVTWPIGHPIFSPQKKCDVLALLKINDAGSLTKQGV